MWIPKGKIDLRLQLGENIHKDRKATICSGIKHILQKSFVPHLLVLAWNCARYYQVPDSWTCLSSFLFSHICSISQLFTLVLCLCYDFQFMDFLIIACYSSSFCSTDQCTVIQSKMIRTYLSDEAILFHDFGYMMIAVTATDIMTMIV